VISVDIRMDAKKALKILNPDFLLDIPVSIFSRSEAYLREAMAANMNIIKRKRVRSRRDSIAAGKQAEKWGSTYEWRLRMAKLGREVETLEGATAPVIPNIKAGNRTGTMIGQIAKSLPPTVGIATGVSGSDMHMEYTIYADKYDRAYPIYFHQWISEVKGIEGGLLPDEEDQERILDILSEDLMSWFKGKA